MTLRLHRWWEPWLGITLRLCLVIQLGCMGALLETQANPSKGILSEIAEKDLTWENLPEELTRMTRPEGDIRLKVGTTRQNTEFLRITGGRNSRISFWVRPPNSSSKGYRAEASQAWYWPEMHLLNLEDEIIVSASCCRLEGKSFDILLNHDTARMVEPKVISLPNGLVPIESTVVRISGLGGEGSPIFKWDNSPSVAATPRLVEEKSNPAEKPADGRQVYIDVLDEKKLRFDDQPCEFDKLKGKIKEVTRKSPDSVFLIRQSPSANSSLVKKVHQTLKESGFKDVQTLIMKPELDPQPLREEAAKPVQVESDSSVPDSPGGRLLWCAAPGKFFLNGKPYEDGSLRQLLRALAKTSPEVPIIVAGPREAPASKMKELALEVKGYGFRDVQLSFPEIKK